MCSYRSRVGWLLVAGALALAPAAAQGATWAAFDELPVGGGELRLLRARQEPNPRPGEAPREQVGFPLRGTKVELEVTGALARVTVEQDFANPFDEALEASYLFPLAQDAAVTGYTIELGERTLRGIIQRRGQARETYERARAEGRTAALLEQERPNIFVQRITNIPAHQAVRVRLTYLEPSVLRDGRYELAVPLTIGPRYLPEVQRGQRPIAARRHSGTSTAGVTSVPYAQADELGQHTLELQAHVDAAVPIGPLESPSHRLLQEQVDATTRRARLDSTQQPPNRDLILRYAPQGERTTVGLLAHRRDHEGYFLLMVQPKASYREGEIAARELILLIDRSGSMQGGPLRQARELARGLVESLGPRDVFNVVAFSDGIERLSSVPQRGDAGGRRAGLAWVDRLRAGGGTELGAGMLRSLADPPAEGRVRLVYLLSDGQVGNDDVILKAAQRSLGRNRIYTVGIGAAPNRHLLDRLAELGRGFSAYLAPADATDALAERLRRKTTLPYLTDVRIDWGGLQVSELEPARLPDVHAGEPLVLTGRYAQPGEAVVRIHATVAGRPTTTELPVALPAEEHRPAIGQLWARRRIAGLTEPDGESAAPAARQAIEELGLRFGLATEYTSFVAVDSTRIVSASGPVYAVEQPAALPAGTPTQRATPPAQITLASLPPLPSLVEPRQADSRADDTRVRRRRRWRAPRLLPRGGGDVDPFTLGLLAALIPLALAARRRR